MRDEVDAFPPRDGEGGEGGSGGGGGGSPPARQDGEPDLSGLTPESVETARSLLRRHRHPVRALAELAMDNFQYREQRRQDETAIKELKSKLPGDGKVALPKAEADDLEEYRKLGTVSELRKTVGEELPTLRSFKESTEAERTAHAAADAMGWKGPVLADLARGKGLRLETRDEKVKVEGKEEPETRRVAYAFRGDSKEAVPLAQLAEADLKDYLPALRRDEGGGSGDAGAGGNGFRFHGSSGGQDDGRPGGLVDKHLEKRRARQQSARKANPLAPPVAD